MGYQDRWSTKADMLKDLAEMTGRIDDIDDNYIAREDKPPPPRIFEEYDDEMNLRYFGEDLHEVTEVAPEPDLQGITQFLRMVNDYNNPPEDNTANTRVKESEQIVISKLNPDVPEFVPSAATCLKGKDNEVIKDTNNLSNVVRDQNDKMTNCKRRKETTDKEMINGKKELISNIDIKIDKRIDISQLNADEIKEITTKLRSKISDATKADNVQLKKEKNVAIATLLKLYSARPRQMKSPQLTDQSDQIKLLTPEHFEKFPAADYKAGINKEQREVNNVAVTSISNETGLTGTNLINFSSKSPKGVNGSIVTTLSKEDLSQTSSPKLEVDKMNKQNLNPDIQESINKVNKWLEKPKSPKPKGPVVCLGPPSFKRKASSIKSPSSEVDSIRSTPSIGAPQVKIGQYKPSKYAEDLSKKFTQQGKALEQLNKDMWERLTDEMKKREMEIKEKAAMNRNGGEESDSNDSRPES